METYHALIPIASPQPPKDGTDEHAITSTATPRLNGGLTVMTPLLGGARFVDGVYVPQSAEVSAA